MKEIPQEWINKYVDRLLYAAGKLPEGAMRDACLLRAEHAMDLVKAFRETANENSASSL